MKTAILSALVGLTCVVYGVRAMSSGAPAGACATMQPSITAGHKPNEVPEGTPAPFELIPIPEDTMGYRVKGNLQFSRICCLNICTIFRNKLKY